MAVAPLLSAAGSLAGAAPLLSAVGSLAGAVQQQRQSSLEAGQAEVAASQQELQVKQREADRKDRLASSLATQNALSGARGIAAFEGSPLTILQDSIEREKTATQRDIFGTELSTLAIRSSAKARKRTARTMAGLRLLQTGADLAQIGGGPKTTGGDKSG